MCDIEFNLEFLTASLFINQKDVGAEFSKKTIRNDACRTPQFDIWSLDQPAFIPSCFFVFSVTEKIQIRSGVGQKLFQIMAWALFPLCLLGFFNESVDER